MKALRVLMLGLLVALSLSGCDVRSPTMDYIWQEPHYPKLKVEVETPEGIKTGCSVIEVKWNKAGRSYNVRGEAVAVDLPKGQTLFVLLRSASNVDWAAYLHQIVKLENSPEDQALYYSRIAANRQVWTIPRTKEYFGNKEQHDNYPYFVRFRDINDPKSVEQMDPDDLAKTFGPGVKLKSFTMQMTDDPVTEGIEKQLGWLSDPKARFVEPYRDPNTGYAAANPNRNPNIPPELSSLDFSTELFK